MAVTDDVIAKCAEIGTILGILESLVSQANCAYWCEGDPDYTDFKALADPQADKVVVLTNELEALVAA